MTAKDDTSKEWYLIENIDTIDSPALVIYRERVSENISTLISMIDDVNRLRPHIKTHKSSEATKLLMAAGINKFKCATIAEAEMLGIAGAPDVLFAYQPTGPKLKRFIELINKYPATTFSCLVDNLQSADDIGSSAMESKLVIKVFIDLNVGMNRTGIQPGDKAIELYKYCCSVDGLSVIGLHAYDGHINSENFEERTSQCNAGFENILAMQQILIREEFPEPVIIQVVRQHFQSTPKEKTLNAVRA